MSTPASRKPLLALAALGLLLMVGTLVSFLLTAISIDAEHRLGLFPFKEEDWYRFLLPSQFESVAKPVVMFLGPSQVRENLRVERFEEALPEYHFYQGGLNLGTVEDAEIALRYIEAAYGEAALPEYVVIGTSPRFLANLPADRPFAKVIDTYSGFSVDVSEAGIALKKKWLPHAIIARLRFVGKQPVRFNAAFRAHMTLVAGTLGNWAPVAAVLRSAGLSEAWEWHLSWFSHPTTPYKYDLFKHLPDEQFEFDDPSSFWYDVVRWDAASDRTAASLRLRRLTHYLDDHGIGFAVVNLPERSVARNAFAFDYEEYLGAIHDGIGSAPFVDLREFSRDSEFYDSEHILPEGSIRMTDWFISWIDQELLGRKGAHLEVREDCAASFQVNMGSCEGYS